MRRQARSHADESLAFEPMDGPPGGRHIELTVAAFEHGGDSIHEQAVVRRVARGSGLGDPDETYRVGDVVQFPTPDGQGAYAGVVREVGPAEEDWALFDFNHPLAGQPVTFEVQVIGVL